MPAELRAHRFGYLPWGRIGHGGLEFWYHLTGVSPAQFAAFLGGANIIGVLSGQL